MTRKRKHIDLRGLDPQSPEYWEEELYRQNLQMARGRSDRLSYVGGSSQLDTLHGFLTTDTGRVVPKGEKPE
jgi:hypothetical protein